MNNGVRTSQRLDTGLRVDPRVLLSSQVLQMSQQELEQSIEAELNENPALERLSGHDEALTEETILRSIAPREIKPRGDDRELWRSLPTDDDTPSWIDLASSSTTLSEHLTAQLLPTIPARLRGVGEYVVGCVNENGYLYEPVEDIANATNCSLEDAELVIANLKKCEPLGVGASGIQECLIIQLRSLDTVEAKVARRIVKDHLDDFTSGRRMKLARRFGVMPQVVNEAFDLILGCSPFPGEAFKGNYEPEKRLPAVRPDLALHRTEQGWLVSVEGPEAHDFAINNFYNKRLETLKVQEDRKSVDKDEKRHLQHYVQRAQDYISSIEQRRRTLRRIGQYLVQHQSGFVTTGSYEFLLPLTRSQLAFDLGLHESTISRATQGKFVQLANGETVSFEVFFKPALRVQKMIEDILATENPDNPLSDERIASLLAEKGVHVARRTVNKYRDRTKLLSSRKRRVG